MQSLAPCRAQRASVVRRPLRTQQSVHCLLSAPNASTEAPALGIDHGAARQTMTKLQLSLMDEWRPTPLVLLADGL